VHLFRNLTATNSYDAGVTAVIYAVIMVFIASGSIDTSTLLIGIHPLTYRLSAVAVSSGP